ncbi:hypothetical protein Ancab_003779 [Ancistrocladus abbreviatus]
MRGPGKPNELNTAAANGVSATGLCDTTRGSDGSSSSLEISKAHSKRARRKLPKWATKHALPGKTSAGRKRRSLKAHTFLSLGRFTGPKKISMKGKKGAAARNSIASNSSKTHAGSKGSTELRRKDCSITGDSISDSDIANMNRLIVQTQEHTSAKEI